MEALTKPKRPDPFLEELAKIFDLEKLLVLDQEYYEQCVYPIMYNYIKDLEIFKRNAAIALGNSGDKKHLDALRQGYEKSNDSDTREIISWAIGKLDQWKGTLIADVATRRVQLDQELKAVIKEKTN